MIGPHDLWLAATCFAHDLTMVTANLREFARIPGLAVEVWGAILGIMFVTDVAREAALKPRVSLPRHGDLQNVLVQARHVRHTGVWWYSSSQFRGQEEG